MADAHPAACSRRLIREAEDQGWSTAELARAIHEHCGHSRLRSHRLAYGWTLDEVVERIGQELGAETETPCRLNASRVSKWERGDEEPGKKYLPALCRVFQSDPMALGLILGFDGGGCSSTIAKQDNNESLLHLRPGGAASRPLPLSEAVEGLRRQLDETLDASKISDSTVDHWESVADGYGRTYRSSPPMAFLVNIVQDITELRLLIDRPLPTAQRRSLCHTTARLAGLLATTLINLGDHREARGWLHSAQRTADESEDPPLRAWVLVRHAVSALYWQDPQGALELANRAALIARHHEGVAGAWAPAVQARALAQLEQAETARAALGRAEEAFSRLTTQPTEQHAYGYTAAQLHFYRSNALTEIGDTRAAYEAQETALSHYGPKRLPGP